MEKNRNILNKALLKLPQYSPEDIVWKDITSRLDNKLVREKISLLSEVEPPEGIWTEIDKELNRREKISLLNQFNPPEKTWERIEKQLEKKEIRPKRKRTIQFVSWTSAIAAVLIIGFFISTLFITKPNNRTYSEEWIEIPTEQQWNENVEEIEVTLDLLCSERPKACQSPDFKKLERELSFLTESKQAILNQLSKYETNRELELLLVKIELERTSLIKEMIEKTI